MSQHAHNDSHAHHGHSLAHIFLDVLLGIFKVAATIGLAWVAIKYINGTPMGGSGTVPDYRDPLFPGSNRFIMWMLGEIHLMLAAFMLGVPLFSIIVEIIGWRTGDKKFDYLAWEFTKLVSTASLWTGILGGGLLVGFFTLYGKYSGYMWYIFGGSAGWYVGLLVTAIVITHLYFLSWDRLTGKLKVLHVLLGVLTNVAGTAIIFMADAWIGFAFTPAGLNPDGTLNSFKEAFLTYSWNPLNIHRLIANVAFGGGVAGAYAAYKFLSASNEQDRRFYDWMGYIGNFIMISAMMFLPFAGYYLAREIYMYNEQMGVSMMGGVFSYLWIMQAMLIGALFLGMNFYLWLSMGKIPGGERYKGHSAWLLVILILCYAVWVTPRSLILTNEEIRIMGGQFHPKLGLLGVMAAKITAVMVMIWVTSISFLFYRRANKVPIVSWAVMGNFIQAFILIASFAIIIGVGIRGYFVPSQVRVNESVFQAIAVVAAFFLCTWVDSIMYAGAKSVGKIRWGEMAGRSQYALVFLAVAFTWLMGLMGYIRSGLRQFDHVYGVLPDKSAGAFLPQYGTATITISVTVLLFFMLIGMIFKSGEKMQRSKEGVHV